MSRVERLAGKGGANGGCAFHQVLSGSQRHAKGDHGRDGEEPPCQRCELAKTRLGSCFRARSRRFLLPWQTSPIEAFEASSWRPVGIETLNPTALSPSCCTKEASDFSCMPRPFPAL